MATKDKGGKAAAEKTKTKAAAAPAPEFKYGVADLAKLMDIEPASVRVQLRNKGVAKNGGTAYGWNTKDELQAVADKLRTSKPEPKAKPKVKAAGTEKAKPVAKKKAA